MEIYSNGTDAQRTVVLEVPVTPTSMQVEARRDTTVLHTFSTVNAVEGGFAVTIPYSLTRSGINFTIRWDINYLEDGFPKTLVEYQDIEIITPVLSLSEIRAIHTTATETEANELEKAVRFIIQAYTGQRFSKFTGTHHIRGNDGHTLLLPERLMRFTSMVGAATPVYVDQGGWVLRVSVPDIPPVRADYHGLHRHRGGTVHNPANISWPRFDSTTTYSISGEWGYDTVPGAVKEAAKLLVNDFASGDNIYRDRFLTSMTAADWRIQFNDRAFDGTGNARADQLLSSFVLSRGWAVI